MSKSTHNLHFLFFCFFVVLKVATITLKNPISQRTVFYRQHFKDLVDPFEIFNSTSSQDSIFIKSISAPTCFTHGIDLIVLNETLEYVTRGWDLHYKKNGNLLFYLDRYGNPPGCVRILDVNNPIKPIPLSTITQEWSSWAITQDNFLFTTEFYQGVKGYNIEDPRNPIQTLHIPQKTRTVEVQDDILFRTNNEIHYFQIYNITDHSNPLLVGSFPMNNIQGVEIIGELAYIYGETFEEEYGIQILNISDYTNPQLLGTYSDLFLIRRVIIHGDYAFLAHNKNGLEILDISNSTNPYSIGNYFTGGLTFDLELSKQNEDILYVIDKVLGLFIFDISNPKEPKVLGNYNTNKLFGGVTVNNNIAFVATFEGLSIVDISKHSLEGECELGKYEIVVEGCDGPNNCMKTSYSIEVVEGFDYGIVAIGFIVSTLTLFLVIVLIILVVIIVYMIRKSQRYKDLNVDIFIKEQMIEKKESKKHESATTTIDNRLIIDASEIKTIKKIGEGGSNSIIYLAEYKNAIVAYKVFQTNLFGSTSYFKEFETEMEIISGLKYPYILNYFGASINPPRVGIVMEFCPNSDIKFFLSEKENNNYPLKKKLEFILQIAKSMEYIHSKHIMHRDLKAENILISESIETRLMDFGLSRSLDNEETKTKRIGTSQYMAPEMVSSTSEYGYPADVFSYSILAWEIILQDFNPYSRSITYNIEMNVSQDENFRPTLDKEVFRNNEWLGKMILKCWDADPNSRLTFQEIIDCFKKNLNNVETTEKNPILQKNNVEEKE